MGFLRLMAGTAGRVARGIAGLALLVLGVAAGGVGGTALGIVGVLVAGLAAANVCLLGPLFKAGFRGPIGAHRS